MQIERQSVPGAEVLAIQGQLDATTASQLERALEDAADYGGGQPLIVDLAGVGLISSAALRVLLSAAKRARRESGKIHLCAANTEVRKVFEISGLAALFDLHDTREGALAATGVSTVAEPAAAPPTPPALVEPPLALPVESFSPPGPEPEPEPEPTPAPTPEPDTEFAPAAEEPPPVPEFAFPPVPSAPASAPEPFPPASVPPPVPSAPAPLFSPPAAEPPFAPPLPVVTLSTPPPPVPPPARPRAAAVPPVPAFARAPSAGAVPTGTTGERRPFPVFPLLAGVLGLGLVLAAASYLLFNRFAPINHLAGPSPSPSVSPAPGPTPSPGPSILPIDTPTPPDPTVATPTPDASPTPTPTPALVTGTTSPPPPTPPNGGGTSADAEVNRVAAPSQVNFDPSDPRNSAVRESVLKRIESMPVSRKVKDQLYAALEQARGMGKVATITFGTGRTDLSPADVESLRKGLAQPVTARLTAVPTVVIVVLGYADTRGDAATNRKISEQRAARTIEALKGPCGLLNIMHSIGMGASELLDGKNADANRAVEVWAVQP